MHSKRLLLLLVMVLIISGQANAQLILTGHSQINTKCNGFGCEYNGPSILINEVMISPFSGDGSIYGQGGSTPQAGEWIELYNPDLCKSIDISCYFLGNNSNDGSGPNNSNYGGGFELPQGTVVPSRGFCVVRGVNAPPVPSNLLIQNGGLTIEIVVDDGNSVCIDGGFRLWFPNAGGWFAFYNRFGVAQDAISWNDNTQTPNDHPCNPPGNCPYTGTLPSYNSIPAIRKHYIYNTDPPTGQSIRRMPDGGNWVINTGATDTYGTCDAACAPAPLVTCTGKASVTVSGGVAPYTFIWDDGMAQTNDTAVGLCDGTYCVTVQDVNGLAATACVVVQDFVPNVTAPASLPDMCQYESPITLTGGSPPGGVYSGTGVTGNQFDPEVAGPGTHVISYKYYNADSCFDSAATTIFVYITPTVTLGAIPPTCISSPTVALTQGYPPGGTYTGTGVSSNSFSPTAAGVGTFTITYHYSSPGGCIDSATSTITVNANPIVTFTPLPGICLNANPLTLTGGVPAGGTYSGTSVSSGKFFPASAGVGTHTITYIYVDANNCLGSATQTIQVLSLPFVSLAPIADRCKNTPAFTLTGGSPAGGTYTGNGVVSGIFDPEMAGSGLFTITYTVIDGQGCKNDSSQKFHVQPLPIVKITPFAELCVDDLPVTLTNGIPSGGTFSGIGVSGNIFNPSVSGTGNFTLTYTFTDTYGCSNDTNAVIKVNPLPQIFNVSGGGYYCLGADLLTVNLDGSETNVNYLLYLNGQPVIPALPGTGSPIDYPSLQDSGVYRIVATNTLTGCSADMAETANIYKIYMPTIELGDTLYFCNAAGIILDAGNFMDTLTYLWSDGTSNRFYTITKIGQVWVKVIKGQCYSTDSMQVEPCNDLRISNVFTPNGDGINEHFLPELTAGEIVKYYIEIFNRWGRSVYISDNVNEGWDGTLNNKGTECSAGVYYYIIRYTPDNSFPNPTVERRLTGQVTLMR